MSNYDFLFSRRRNRNLLIVEGECEEVKLFKLLLKSFPEVQVSPESIMVYGTNIYRLHEDIVAEYGTDWTNEDVDLPFIITKKQGDERPLRQSDFTNIVLIFDYERQEPRFGADTAVKLIHYFDDETGNGKLYFNYPMIEAYRDLHSLPDPEFENRTVSTSMLSGQTYKNNTLKNAVSSAIGFPLILSATLKKRYEMASEEDRNTCTEKLLKLIPSPALPDQVSSILSPYLSIAKLQAAIHQIPILIKNYNYRDQNYYDFSRNVFKQIIIHNIQKANKIQNGIYQVPDEDLLNCFEHLDFKKILEIQNNVSADQTTGFIWVLCTCVMFIPDYNPNLLGL